MSIKKCVENAFDEDILVGLYRDAESSDKDVWHWLSPIVSVNKRAKGPIGWSPMTANGRTVGPLRLIFGQNPAR